MNLRAYYSKIREIESRIPEEFSVVVSLETPDGGKPGVRSEVSRRTAAKLAVEGKARMANSEEADEYRSQLLAASEQAKKDLEARKIRIAVIPESEYRSRKPIAKSNR